MRLIVMFFMVMGVLCFSQEQNKEELKAEKRAINYVYSANELVQDDNYVEAEMEYRKAISEAPNEVVGAYNLAHSYYKKGSYGEALFRSEEAAKNAKTKAQKHKAYHNAGNTLMQFKHCKKAVEAFKNALRNNPLDEETRYNLALAKACAAQQKDGGGEDDKNDENKDEEKDKEDDQKKEDDTEDKDDKKDQGDKDKKDGDKKEDEKGQPKDDKKEKGKEGAEEKKDEKPKPKAGQMSPQQIKNILEAMQNQEQKVQQKINAKKQKGVKIKIEKDW